jgi:predicted PurR-regulated permease PerM
MDWQVRKKMLTSLAILLAILTVLLIVLLLFVLNKEIAEQSNRLNEIEKTLDIRRIVKTIKSDKKIPAYIPHKDESKILDGIEQPNFE